MITLKAIKCSTYVLDSYSMDLKTTLLRALRVFLLAFAVFIDYTTQFQSNQSSGPYDIDINWTHLAASKDYIRISKENNISKLYLKQAEYASVLYIKVSYIWEVPKYFLPPPHQGVWYSL